MRHARSIVRLILAVATVGVLWNLSASPMPEPAVPWQGPACIP